MLVQVLLLMDNLMPVVENWLWHVTRRMLLAAAGAGAGAAARVASARLASGPLSHQLCGVGGVWGGCFSGLSRVSLVGALAAVETVDGRAIIAGLVGIKVLFQILLDATHPASPSTILGLLFLTSETKALHTAGSIPGNQGAKLVSGILFHATHLAGLELAV